jgi:hypothetical protein
MSTPFESYFVEAGRRAHVVWRLEGSFGGSRDASTEIINPPGGGTEGVWVEPLRVLDGLDFAVWQPDSGLLRLERCASAYRRKHGVSEISYRLPSFPSIALRKRVWVPLHEPAVIVDLQIDNRSVNQVSMLLFGESRFRLSLGWPLGTTATPQLALSEDRQLVRSSNRFGQAVLLLHDAPTGWWLDEGPLAYGAPRSPDRCWWSHELGLAGHACRRVRAVVAASENGESAVQVARRVLEQADILLERRVERYRTCAEIGPRLSTPARGIDRAFAMARAALEDFKHDDPRFGLGYFAGFPAYNFYFAGDAFRIMYGAIELGDWDDSREALRTIIRGQRQEDAGQQLRGELWHELSTTGHAISPNFVTLELPSILLHYLRWTADLDFIRETYPAAKLAAEWASRKDANGDGLPDNGPEQTFADGVREDLNVAGAHLTPALWQLRAYRDVAELAQALDETDAARWWRQQAARTAHLIERNYWDEYLRKFAETVRPDGLHDFGLDFSSQIELADGLDEGMSRLSLAVERESEILGGDGGATAAFRERRQALSYYLVERGDRARRLLQAGHSDEGLRALVAIAEMPFRWPERGFFPEIASNDGDIPDLRGCFHQGWTPSYGLVHPTIAGLWGIKPDALNHRLEIAPRPPREWAEMTIRGVRFGAHEVALVWRQIVGQELICRNRGQALELTVSFKRPEGIGSVQVLINGRSLHTDEIGSSCEDDGGSVRATVRLGAGQEVTLLLEWSPAPIMVEAPLLLARVAPGETTQAGLSVMNNGPAPFNARVSRDGEPLLDISALAPGAAREVAAIVRAPEQAHGYVPLRFMLRSTKGIHLWSQAATLPVFPPLQAVLEGPGAALAGRNARVHLRLTNLCDVPRRVQATFRNLKGGAACLEQTAWIEPNEELRLTESLPIEDSLGAQIECWVRSEGFELRPRVTIPVANGSRRLVLYCGFLAPPFGDADVLVHHVPANYAVRRPDRLLDVLPYSSALVLTDQQDAVFTPELVSAIQEYVQTGGRLLFVCYWSAAWGRGFHHTYCSIARTDLTELLPLAFEDEICTTDAPRLQDVGAKLWSDLPWDGAPAIDYNRAELRPGATVWALAADGTPVAAHWRLGGGRVAAIGFDCFGFGYGTLAHWRGQRQLLQRALDWLLGQTQATPHTGVDTPF